MTHHAFVGLRALARALDGEVSGAQIQCPGPGHSRKDRSLSIRFLDTAPDGLVVHSFAGDDPLRCRAHVLERLGCRRPAWRGEHLLGRLSNPDHRLSTASADAERDGRALSLWHEAVDPRGTPVETHLKKFRGITLPPESAGEAIRYHPRCRFGRKITPSMLCLVRNIDGNESQAIHRTALAIDGHKVKVDGHDRLSLGPTVGGAIKLTPDEDVTTCLGIGEGVETTLSLRNVSEFGPSPIWCLLSARGIASFPVLAGIECLWIAVDNDESGVGQRAARTCAHRWRAKGREVFLVMPTAVRNDLNDLFAGAHDA